MRTFFFIACLLIAGLLVLPNPAGAFDPQNPAVGARPLALGKAFVGLADDSSAIFLNPAGLARISSLKLMNFYTTPFSDNAIVAVSAVQPNFFGVALGAAYINNTTSGLILNTTEFSQTEQQFLLGFASKINDKLSAGTSLNIITRGFSIQSSLLASNRGSGMDMDLGFFYELRENLSAGVNLQNILPVGFGGRFTFDSGTTESLPANLKAGLSWKFRRDLNLLFDLDYPLERVRPPLLHFGLEFQPNNMIALRGGFDQSPQTPDTRTDVYTHTTLGIGINLRGYTFDYTYYKHGDPSGDVTNYFSMGYVGPGPAVKRPTMAEA
ncbi:MAG: PorV/PorQ family protein, partial [Candidatus Margulisbacteria bacterium]|nr:PorV/PorQ family protein [Candidatus Margulisiibacteriota bacterium]